MFPRILFASLLIAIANCIVSAEANSLPLRSLLPLGNSGTNAIQKKQPTSDAVQLGKCFPSGPSEKMTHSRLLLTWHSTEQPADPVEYLRKIIFDDLLLPPKLAYGIKQVQIFDEKLLFEMSNILFASKIYRSYCKILADFVEHRLQGYNDSPLTFEIAKTDLNFYAD